MKLASTYFATMMLVMTASIYANPGVNCDSSNNTTETICFNQDEISALIISTFIMTMMFLVFMIGFLFITSIIFKKMFTQNTRTIVSIIINSIILNLIYHYVKNNYY